MSSKIRLNGGPADGEMVTVKKGTSPVECVGVQLDANLHHIVGKQGELFAYAIYRLAHKGSQPFYYFTHIQRHPDPNKGFDVEFIDGPFQGIRPFGAAIQFQDMLVRLPIGADGNLRVKGNKISQVAEYGRKKVDGVWKMALVRLIDDPDEIEKLSDAIAEHELTAELQSYTSDQLIKELSNRQTFNGIVIFTQYDGKVAKKGDIFNMAIGRPLVNESNPSITKKNAAILLQSALDGLSKG